MTESPVTPGQEQVWFFDQVVEDGTFHTVPVYVDITGPLDRAALTEALTALVRRHEPLRTSYAVRDNEVVAMISPDATVPVAFHDLCPLPAPVRAARAEAVVAGELARRIELSGGPLRPTLLRLDDDVHRLVLIVHHIAIDGASVAVLQRELLACYDAAVAGREPELPELPACFRDFAARSREGDHTEDVQRWREDLADLPEPAELPGARTRPAPPDFASDSLPLVVPADLATAVRKLARDNHSSPYMVLLTAFSVLLHRLTGVRDLVIGTPSAGRGDDDTQDLVGYFVNMLPLRIRLGWDATAHESMGQVRDAVLTALDRRDTPFHHVVRALRPSRDLDRHPVFQLVFACPPPLAAPSAAGGATFGFTQGTSTQSMYDLEVQLPDSGHGELRGWAKFRTSLYHRRDMADLLARFVTVLRQVTEAPDVRLSNQSLLEPEEYRAITRDRNANATGYPALASLVELFHQVVDRYPDDVAVEFGDHRLTYRELDQRANRFANGLPAAPVGVFLERGVDWVVAVLAILKAGGAYLPLDPDYPADRLAMLCADAGVRVVVSDRPLPELPSVTAVTETGEGDPERPNRTVAPDDLAYVMYTSGSTGRPKGVCVTHRNVIRLVRDTDYVVFEHGDRIAQASTTTFDAATFEVWGSLLSGGCLVGLAKDVALNPPELGRWLRTNEIDMLLLTTSLAMHVAREAPSALSSLRYFVFGGEQPDTTAVAMLAAHDGGPEHIVNGYGPTETTTFAATHRCNDVRAGDTRIPLGTPLNNSSLHIVDSYLEPVPLGVVGELCIGGDGVARGYVGAPELTAERFVPDHLGGRPGARMYRTGDLARLLQDGTVEFLGRIDRQVKIRGFRIEPGEVEAALRASGLVREAVVVPRDDGAGDARLIGYVVLAQPGRQQLDVLGDYLRGTLPDYLVPSSLVALDAFPLTRNGKLDLRELPEPAADEPSGPHARPRTPTERQLTEAWEAVLGTEGIGRDTNFFDLGGHSLKATRLVARIANDLGVDVSLRLLFDHPTIAGLAAEVERLRAATPVPVGAPALRTPDRSRLSIVDLLDDLDHAER
ncbi:MAG: amino acid adenylation domain-containing protein [Actinophytocola sp.]|uniref:non-ribosomal peptide synthetase n=1 Tax=Actinophytocola sp. TaxID=1872138 RepID=UPI003C754CAE